MRDGEYLSRRPSLLCRFLDHLFGREPGDGIGFYVMVFKCNFEIVDKNQEGSHSDSGAYKSVVSKSCCPGLCRSFGHIGEGKGNFLCIGVVYFLVYCKVEHDGVEPLNGFLIGSIKGFRGANAEFDGFWCRGHLVTRWSRNARRNRWEDGCLPSWYRRRWSGRSGKY